MTEPIIEAETVVLMPVFNPTALLKHAVASVVQQDYQAWKLLVINDGGSPVEPWLRSFEDPRIHLINREHAGKSAALNAGLTLSCSEFVAYLDDDDFYLPQHLKLLTDYLKGHADCAAVCSRTVAEYWPEFPADGIQPTRAVEYDSRFNTTEMRIHNMIPNLNVVHRRELFELTGTYDECLPFYIDWDLLRRISYVADFHGIPDITGVYRRIQGKTHVSRSSFASDASAHAAVRAYVGSKWPGITRQVMMSPAPHQAAPAPVPPDSLGVLAIPSSSTGTAATTLADACTQAGCPCRFLDDEPENRQTGFGMALKSMVTAHPTLRRILVVRDNMVPTGESLAIHANTPEHALLAGPCSSGAPFEQSLYALEPILACLVIRDEQARLFRVIRNAEMLSNISWPVDRALEFAEYAHALPADSLWTPWMMTRFLQERAIPCLYHPHTATQAGTSPGMNARIDAFRRAAARLSANEEPISADIDPKLLHTIVKRRAASSALQTTASQMIERLNAAGGPDQASLQRLAEQTNAPIEQLQQMLPVFFREQCETAFFENLNLDGSSDSADHQP